MRVIKGLPNMRKPKAIPDTRETRRSETKVEVTRYGV